MQSWIPPELQGSFWQGLSAIALSFMGRLLWHVREVQGKRRQFWSIDLVWESVTAVCIGLAGLGVAEYMDVAGKPAFAVIIFVAYLGPRGLEHLLFFVIGKVSAARGGKS